MARKPGLVLALVLMAVTAKAGTELKFVTGTYQTKALQSQWSSFFNQSATQDYVVQFKGAITEADKQALKATGAQIFRYVPDDALIVRATKATLDQFSAQTGKVQGVVPFHSEWKKSINLPSISVFSLGAQENILITAFTAADATKILNTLKANDPELVILDNADRYVAVRMSLPLVNRIASMTGVEYIEKMEKIETMDMILAEATDVSAAAAGDYTDITGFETGTKLMNLDSAWAKGFAGEGQIVGMADTGLDRGDVRALSPDFVGAIQNGYAFGAGAKNWADPNGHGTHVAGSVLGRGTNSGGKLVGSAWKAKLVAEGMWSPIMDNLTVPPQLSKLFEAARKEGARIHTNSWGSPANLGVYDSMSQKVDEYMWNNPDFLVMFAAGNSGVDKDKNGVIDHGSVSTPGTAKNCLTVGASENNESKGGIQRKISELQISKDNWPAEPIWSSKISDNPNGISMFSSRGPSRDGRLKPEIVAPGTNILSVKSQEPGASDLWGAYNSNYAWSGGTSMATPLAAGAAAVAREILMKKHGQVDPSAALVKTTLMHTAFDLYPGQYGEGSATQELIHRPNDDEGYGRVDMDKLSSMDLGTTIVDSKDGVAQGQAAEVVLNVNQGQSLLVNLVYTDAPGTPSSGLNLVNNIDLVVVTPDGQELGNKDVKNNNEIIELSNLKAGSYKVQVRGTKIPMGKNGKQPYALMATVSK